jgi:hypothetical protein
MEHAKDTREMNEVYIQRNQMSTCMQRYDVRAIPLLVCARDLICHISSLCYAPG